MSRFKAHLYKNWSPVEALVTPRSKEQLLEVYKTIRAFGREPIIIGNGSNILASDGRIASIAVKPTMDYPR